MDFPLVVRHGSSKSGLAGAGVQWSLVKESQESMGRPQSYASSSNDEISGLKAGSEAVKASSWGLGGFVQHILHPPLVET